MCWSPQIAGRAVHRQVMGVSTHTIYTLIDEANRRVPSQINPHVMRQLISITLPGVFTCWVSSVQRKGINHLWSSLKIDLCSNWGTMPWFWIGLKLLKIFILFETRLRNSIDTKGSMDKKKTCYLFFQGLFPSQQKPNSTCSVKERTTSHISRRGFPWCHVLIVESQKFAIFCQPLQWCLLPSTERRFKKKQHWKKSNKWKPYTIDHFLQKRMNEQKSSGKLGKSRTERNDPRKKKSSTEEASVPCPLRGTWKLWWWSTTGWWSFTKWKTLRTTSWPSWIWQVISHFPASQHLDSVTCQVSFHRTASWNAHQSEVYCNCHSRGCWRPQNTHKVFVSFSARLVNTQCKKQEFLWQTLEDNWKHPCWLLRKGSDKSWSKEEASETSRTICQSCTRDHPTCWNFAPLIPRAVVLLHLEIASLVAIFHCVLGESDLCTRISGKCAHKLIVGIFLRFSDKDITECSGSIRQTCQIPSVSMGTWCCQQRMEMPASLLQSTLQSSRNTQRHCFCYLRWRPQGVHSQTQRKRLFCKLCHQDKKSLKRLQFTNRAQAVCLVFSTKRRAFCFCWFQRCARQRAHAGPNTSREQRIFYSRHFRAEFDQRKIWPLLFSSRWQQFSTIRRLGIWWTSFWCESFIWKKRRSDNNKRLQMKNKTAIFEPFLSICWYSLRTDREFQGSWPALYLFFFGPRKIWR